MRGETISTPETSELIAFAEIANELLVVYLDDGRVIATPLTWYPILLAATAEQRARFQISGGGFGLHWPELDEDLSVAGMLRGSRGSTHRRVEHAIEVPASVRVRVRQWISAHAASDTRFQAEEFNAFIGELVADLDPEMRALAIQAAHAEAQHVWPKTRG